MKRHRRLKADPEKVREFLRRGRQPLTRREELKRAGAKAKAARSGKASSEGPLSPAAWRAAVFAASGGRCIVTGARAKDAEDRRFHAHHAVAQDVLRQRRLHDRLWDARNGVWLAAAVHMAHEHAGGESRVPRELLPASVWEFARELDALDGTSWATEHVKRYHPAAGSSGAR